MHSLNETTLNERIEQRRRVGSLPRFIAVEGPIGAGKTSLAKRLAMTFGYDLLLEQAEENPFLTRFYQDPARYALQTELFFLFQRADQLRQIQQQDLFAGPRIADFLIQDTQRLTIDQRLAGLMGTTTHCSQQFAPHVHQLSPCQAGIAR